MSTTKQRINITTNLDVEQALRQAAKRDGVPMATKASELLTIGLELEEDMALTTIATERSANSSEFVSHEQAWR